MMGKGWEILLWLKCGLIFLKCLLHKIAIKKPNQPVGSLGKLQGRSGSSAGVLSPFPTVTLGLDGGSVLGRLLALLPAKPPEQAQLQRLPHKTRKEGRVTFQGTILSAL